ncbi:MAG: hypothetical protein ACREQ4_10315 [Candidatus Binataceae bacterium]
MKSSAGVAGGFSTRCFALVRRLALLMIPGAIVAIATGCAPMSQMNGLSPQEQAQNVDPMLQAAGFQELAAATPQQKQDLKSLPPYRIHYYTDSNGINHYWLADPSSCGCLFEGGEAAYQRYENIKLQNQMTEEQQRAAEAQMQAQQMGGPMGPGFGGPLGFGGFGGGFGIGGPGIGLVF